MGDPRSFHCYQISSGSLSRQVQDLGAVWIDWAVILLSMDSPTSLPATAMNMGRRGVGVGTYPCLVTKQVGTGTSSDFSPPSPL